MCYSLLLREACLQLFIQSRVLQRVKKDRGLRVVERCDLFMVDRIDGGIERHLYGENLLHLEIFGVEGGVEGVVEGEEIDSPSNNISVNSGRIKHSSVNCQFRAIVAGMDRRVPATLDRGREDNRLRGEGEASLSACARGHVLERLWSGGGRSRECIGVSFGCAGASSVEGDVGEERMGFI
jgi:hypothetical protein